MDQRKEREMETIVRRSERIKKRRATVLARRNPKRIVIRLTESPGFGNGVGSLGLLEPDRKPDREQRTGGLKMPAVEHLWST